MFILGSSALLLALLLAICSLVMGAVALRQISTGRRGPISPERLSDAARRAGMMGFAAVSAAVFALLWAIFTNDFSFTYVLHESNRALPQRTSLPRSGLAKRDRCCCGPGCWQGSASSFACGTQPASGLPPLRRPFWLASRSSFFFCSTSRHCPLLSAWRRSL